MNKMKRVKYLKQFNEILVDLRLECVNCNIEPYFYTWVKAYIEKIHFIMSIEGKELVFKAMYLALSESAHIRSRYEIYAYKLVAERFRKYKVLKLCVRWLYDTKNRF